MAEQEAGWWPLDADLLNEIYEVHKRQHIELSNLDWMKRGGMLFVRKLVEDIELNFLDQYSEYKHGKSSNFWQQLRKEVGPE